MNHLASMDNTESAAQGRHPLEAILPLRRAQASPWRDLFFTFVWNCLVGTVLTAVEQLLARTPPPLLGNWLGMLLAANIVGFLIHGALYAVYRWAPQLMTGKRQTRRLVQIVVAGACAIVGIALARVLLSGDDPLGLIRSNALTRIAAYAIVTAVIMRISLSIGERRAERATQAARQQEQIATAGRLLSEARLRALQAQIEPHFLYNTLANVVSLIDTQPAQARRMLERFIDYLRASLAASRAEAATLGGELDLVRAYLDVLAVRLGPRLRYRIEAELDTRALPIAPMLLQPLVENAVMHGIEPKLEGGEIVVRASVAGDALCVEVGDTGMGLNGAPPRPGSGVGLANLRERVRQLHGPGAGLQLLENQPCGVRARLLLPFTKVPPSTPHAP